LGLALLMARAELAAAQFFPETEPANAEIVFGCSPGPVEELHHADPPLPPARVASPRDADRVAVLRVDTGSGRVVDGHGFNLEHTLWSCPPFRRVLGRALLTSFQPDVARVDSGQLPFAPEHLPAESLGFDVYQRMMDDPKYGPSWAMLRRLNDENVRLILGVWGGPGQFNDDGTRRGQLLPQYADAYIDYVVALVDYLVLRQDVAIWSVTVANEPDGGDGTYIPPELYLDVAAKLGPRVARYGVHLNGPDTASAANAMPYLERILATPEVFQWFGMISTHEYFTNHALAQLIDQVRRVHTTIPVYVTEYTSFRYGAMDRGQEASNEIGHMLDSLQVYASVMNAGADAALYWDAVDYYQAGHAAVTRWGLLRGPDAAFAARTRYFGFQQILPYVQAGSVVHPIELSGPDRFAALAIGGGTRRPNDLMIAAINRSGPIQLAVSVDGPSPRSFEVYVTDLSRHYEHVGRIESVDGRLTLTIPARSVTTLTASPPPDDELGE
jgi:O-glycosyl hydrolase